MGAVGRRTVCRRCCELLTDGGGLVAGCGGALVLAVVFGSDEVLLLMEVLSISLSSLSEDDIVVVLCEIAGDTTDVIGS